MVMHLLAVDLKGDALANEVDSHLVPALRRGGQLEPTVTEDDPAEGPAVILVLEPDFDVPGGPLALQADPLAVVDQLAFFDTPVLARLRVPLSSQLRPLRLG